MFWYSSSTSTTASGSAEGGKTFEGETLNAVSKIEEVAAVDAQLQSEVARRGSLKEPTQDQHESRARMSTTGQGRMGEDVEHASTALAAVFNQRRAIAGMGCLR